MKKMCAVQVGSAAATAIDSVAQRTVPLKIPLPGCEIYLTRSGWLWLLTGLLCENRGEARRED